MASFLLNMLALTEWVTGGVLSRTSSRVTATAMDRDQTAIALQNIVSIRDGNDFTISFTMNLDLTSSLAGGGAFIAVLNSHTPGNDWFADSSTGNHYVINPSYTSGSSLTLFLDELAGGGLQRRDSLVITIDTTYYYEWVKVGSVISLDAWTDSGKGTHISGFPLSYSAANDVSMDDLFVLSSFDIPASGQDWYGYVENMIADFGGGAAANNPLISPIFGKRGILAA